MRCCFIEARDRTILKKIVLYCDRIADNVNRYNGSYESFCTDYLFQDACCMCIVQIGELVGLLSEDAKQLNRNVPWRAIKDTRNFYVHNYGAVDLATVWETMNQDIPPLRRACREMLGENS